MGKLVIFAHRGQGPTSRKFMNKTLPEGVIPENSMPAFEKALKEGSEGFELDVFLTKDKKVVVCHDDELDRNVNGKYNCWGREPLQVGRISEKTLQEVQALDIGNGEKMPSLQEVIDLASKYANDPTINIEIKGKGDVVEATHDLMAKAIAEHPDRFSWKSFMINSFDSKALEDMHNLHPDPDLRISQGNFTWSIYGAHDDTTAEWVPVVRDRTNECGILKLDAMLPLNEIEGKLEGAKKAIIIVGDELSFVDTTTKKIDPIPKGPGNEAVYKTFLDSQAGKTGFHLSDFQEITPIKALTGNNDLKRKGDGAIVMDGEKMRLKPDIDRVIFENTVVQAKNNGCTAIDVVSSDLSDSMMEICNRHGMAITATTNAIRAKAQKDIEEPGHGKSEEQIEQDEIKKMFDLGAKYPKVDIYYKADDPAKALAYRDKLEQQAQVRLETTQKYRENVSQTREEVTSKVEEEGVEQIHKLNT